MLNALTDYDLFVVEKLMSRTLTVDVLNSAFGQGYNYLDAYCEETRSCAAQSVIEKLTKTAKRLILFQG